MSSRSPVSAEPHSAAIASSASQPGAAALCGSAETGDRLDIVTGDRDLLALVRDAAPRVRVLYTVRGVSELAVYDERAVEEKYGVPPARYADFAMLRGDPSDGLPGVPGVGEKTAAKLIRAYPSLDALLEDLGTQPARLAVRLTAARGYLDAMRRVVPARAGVRVEVKAGERDAALLEDLSERGGLGGPLRRLSEAMEQ
jgi:5'-3' exonuclease